MKSGAQAHFVALLRAVNVGGTGALPMAELAALAAGLGFDEVRTYIQSGNIVFKSALPESQIRAKLENALAVKMGKAVAVLVRTGAELRAILAANPFPKANPSQLAVVFLSEAPPAGVLKKLVIPGGEEVRLHGREVFVHYPDGMGRSKLKLAPLGTGTARNLNTVAKLAALTGAQGGFC